MPFPCPNGLLGDATLDIPALSPGFGVPGNMMDPNCGCGWAENISDEDMDGRVAALTLGLPLNVVLDPRPNNSVSSSAGCRAAGPLLLGPLSSKSMSESTFVDEPPSSGGIGFDEKE